MWCFSQLQKEVEALIDSDIKFTDIFDYQKPANSTPFCAAGYTSINAGQADSKHECLKLKVCTAEGAQICLWSVLHLACPCLGWATHSCKGQLKG